MALCCAAKSINHQCLQLFVVAMNTFSAITSSSTTTLEFEETKITMFTQDFSGGPNISDVPVAGLSSKLWGLDQFGTFIVFDCRLTESPSPTSATIGRAQGLVVMSALNGRNAHVLMSIVFTNKKYNGSTLEIQGTSRQFEQVREVSVVSGTGKFRFARGNVIIETYSVASNYESAVVRYDIVTVQQK